MSLKTLTEKKQREREETTLQFRGGCAPLQLPLRPFITQISATVGQRQREPRYHTVRSEHVRGNIVQAIRQRLCVCCRRGWGPGRSLVLDTINTLAHTQRLFRPDQFGKEKDKRSQREVGESIYLGRGDWWQRCVKWWGSYLFQELLMLNAIYGRFIDRSRHCHCHGCRKRMSWWWSVGGAT